MSQKTQRTRWGGVVNAMPRPLYLRERTRVPDVEKAGWALWPEWTTIDKRKFLSPTAVRIRIVQPVVSQPSDYSVPTLMYCVEKTKERSIFNDAELVRDFRLPPRSS